MMTTKIDLTPDELRHLRIIALKQRRRTSVPAILAALARKFISQQLRKEVNGRG